MAGEALAGIDVAMLGVADWVGAARMAGEAGLMLLLNGASAGAV
jgi:hypothetical protein